VRGLKLYYLRMIQLYMMSHPAWGAWIEIREVNVSRLDIAVAPRMGCVD